VTTENAIETSERKARLVPRLFAFVLVGGCLYLFWPLLFADQRLTYRDASYLYQPLFNYIQMEWEAGSVPLWNPYCGLGQPLLADGSSSVFYPGKAVFFANFLPFTARFGMYVVAHLLLAGAGAYFCCRRFGVSELGCSIAGLSFAFGAPLLSQANNVVYLVGGAWLPWSMMLIWILRKTEKRWSVAGLLGVVWSMMILGGDAQMVYHSLLCFAVLLLGITFLACRTAGGTNAAPNDRWKTVVHLSVSCSVAITVAVLLSAVQLLPASQAVSQSVRSQFEKPRSLYEVPSYLLRDDSAGLVDGLSGLATTPWPKDIRPHQEISHLSDFYQFSLPPWTLCEVVFPNFGGKSYPENHRWLDDLSILPEMNRRSWYPSLYLGAMTIVLAICGMRFFKPSSADESGRGWLTLIAAWFCIGSFGVFGIGMAVNWLSGIDEPTIGPQVGGIYWMMTVVLPKYVLFRYPAKLFLVSGLCLSILAGIGIDRLLRGECVRRFLIIELALLAAIFFGLIGMGFNSSRILNLLGGRDPESSVVDALAATFGGLGHALLFLLVVPTFLAVLVRPGKKTVRPLVSSLVIGLFAVDLLLANGWLIDSGPAVDATRATQLAEESKRGRFRLGFETSEPQLDKELIQWQSDSLEPKFHLPFRAHRVDSFSSIERADWAFFFSESKYYPNTVEALLRSHSNIFLARKVAVLPNGNESSPIDSFRRSQEVLEMMTDGFTVVEVDNDWEGFAGSSGSTEAHIELQSFSSNRLQFQVTVDREILIVANEQFDSGWRCRFKTVGQDIWRQTDVLRTNRVMRGILLPAGKHSVVMVYRPRSFVIGSWLSLLGWSALLISLFRRAISRKTN